MCVSSIDTRTPIDRGLRSVLGYNVHDIRWCRIYCGARQPNSRQEFQEGVSQKVAQKGVSGGQEGVLLTVGRPPRGIIPSPLLARMV